MDAWYSRGSAAACAITRRFPVNLLVKVAATDRSKASGEAGKDLAELYGCSHELMKIVADKPKPPPPSSGGGSASAGGGSAAPRPGVHSKGAEQRKCAGACRKSKQQNAFTATQWGKGTAAKCKKCTDQGQKLRECRSCGVEKPPNAFTPTQWKKGYDAWCNKCNRRHGYT
jgi:hypothetical protein